MIKVETRFDSERGCGWRKPGGLYLIAPPPGAPCGRLPLPLDVCPVCGQGIHFSRSWTWINPSKLLADAAPCRLGKECSQHCPLSHAQVTLRQRDGLLWIGKEHYATVAEYQDESVHLGISRRIKAVPRGFVVGVTWVWLAHIEAIPTRDAWLPGVFQVFLPTAVEYVVTGKEKQADLAKLAARGITPVRIERVGAGENAPNTEEDSDECVCDDDDNEELEDDSEEDE